MPPLTHSQYEILERAIARGSRIAVVHHGTELVLLPERLRVVAGREALDARHPSTGDRLTLVLDELEAVESVTAR
jgi:hypothetical protein